MMQLSQVARVVNGRPSRPLASETVTGVSTDTRSIRAGDLFFALRGSNFDAHDYLDHATRLSTMLTPPAIPWPSRHPVSSSIDPDAAHSTDSAAKASRPAINGGRRPVRSLIGPAMSCPTASPSMHAVTVS